jgi:hypothetical protein
MPYLSPPTFTSTWVMFWVCTMAHHGYYKWLFTEDHCLESIVNGSSTLVFSDPEKFCENLLPKMFVEFFMKCKTNYLDKTILKSCSTLLRYRDLQRGTPTKLKLCFNIILIFLHQVATSQQYGMIYHSINVKCSTEKKVWHDHFLFCRRIAPYCRPLERRTIEWSPF